MNWLQRSQVEINMKPVDAIVKIHILRRKSPGLLQQPVLSSNVTIRYLYEPGELEGSSARTTDPIWSVNMDKIISVIRSTVQPTIYRLYSTAPESGFVREQLQVIPENTHLSPGWLRAIKVR